MVCPLTSRERLPNGPQTKGFNHALWWLVIALAVILPFPFLYNQFKFDQAGRPFCHKNIMMAFRIWTSNHATDQFPNAHGSSRESLALLRQELVTDEVEKNYMYVPGLGEKDPGGLVLMYLRVPTRWIWHGPPRRRYHAKQWIIVPLDFKFYTAQRPERPGECSESVPYREFRTRLLATLDFLRTNNRPNWQAVVAEHTKLLESIERRKP